MSLRLLAFTAALTAMLLLAACGGDDDDDGATSSSGDTPATEASGGDGDEDGDGEASGSGASADLSEVDACSLLTREEVEAAVGNSVEDGAEDFGISCAWDSEPEVTSVSVYFLLVDGDLCEQALSDDATYEETDGFGSPAFTSYNDGGGIGQSDVVVCLENAQMQLIVTGGFGVDPVEADLRKAAEDLTQLVLSRL
jgi:hypothetical protein